MTDQIRMATDWILRCGDGENFKNSSKHELWGISSKPNTNKHFMENVKRGDRLWFVKSKSHGKVVAVATYRSYNPRFGPLIDISLSDKELGWNGGGAGWSADVEVHYTDLYRLNDCELLTHIKGAASIRKHNEKCRVDLAVEYSYIVRYSKVTLSCPKIQQN